VAELSPLAQQQQQLLNSSSPYHNDADAATSLSVMSPHAPLGVMFTHTRVSKPQPNAHQQNTTITAPLVKNTTK